MPNRATSFGKLPFPEESGLKLTKFNPTAITVAPNGDIFLADRYASDHIFKFDKAGKYLMHFGTKGNGLREFNTAHGMTLDTRHTPPRLLICDRNHRESGCQSFSSSGKAGVRASLRGRLRVRPS